MAATPSEAAAPPPPRGHRLREAAKFGVVVLFVWLAGQIVTQGVSDEFAMRRPGAAVAWRADSPDALTALAQSRLAARDPAHAAAFARRALAGAPLKVAAMSALGFALDQAGDSKQAEQTMRFAGTRGWRDALTQLWLMAHDLREREYGPSFERADALLRRADVFQNALMRSLVYVADRVPIAIPPLANRLSLAPDWRREFLILLANDRHPESAATDRTLLELLAKSKQPPTDQEVGFLLDRLVRDHQYSQAEAAWRQLSPHAPPAGELVVDGDFDHLQGIGPFGWSISQAVGWTSSINPAPGDGHGQALRLEYDGFSPPQELREILFLTPGDYRLSGDLYQESGDAVSQSHWTVNCAEGNSRTTSTPQPAQAVSGRWIRFETSFSVPQGCDSQWLALTAEQGDHHADTVVWYDNLVINPYRSSQ